MSTKKVSGGSQFISAGKTHYQNNKQYYLERNRQTRKEKRDYIVNIKKQGQCVDCGLSDYRVLDFDHVNGTKLCSISEMPNKNWSYERIDLEIAKCVLRCANCHRIITYERAGLV